MQITGNWNLFAGWAATLSGVLSGAIIGLFFHRQNWRGGYDSHPRRFIRLGHISFFGLGFTNVLFGLTVQARSLSGGVIELGAASLILSVITMPICCFLAAWRKPLRHLFPVPVLSALVAVISLLASWR